MQFPYVNRSAVGFAKTERNPSFSGRKAKIFLCEEKWIWRFGLIFLVLFYQEKRT